MSVVLTKEQKVRFICNDYHVPCAIRGLPDTPLWFYMEFLEGDIEVVQPGRTIILIYLGYCNFYYISTYNF